MNRDPISSTYAAALLQLGEERGELEAIENEIPAILELLRTDADFRTFIQIPSIEAAEKNQVLDRVLRGKVSETLLDAMQIVIQKHRQAHLEAILEEFQSLLDEKLGRVHAEVTSAVALDEKSRTELTRAISKKLDKTILLENSVDAGILGGLILRFGDLVVDGSVRTQLKKLSARLDAVKVGSEFVHED